MQFSEIVINEGFSGLNPVQFGYESCAKNWSFGPAMRTYWLLHYVVSGCGEFHRDGKVYKIGAGNIFVIPPYIEIYYEADAENPWEYIWVGFETDMELPLEITKPVIHCPAAAEIFNEMKGCSKFESGRSAFLSSMLWKLVSAIAESNSRSFGYAEKALNFMHADYMFGISVNDIAERLNLDRSYFSVLFKKSVGVSPVKYLIDLRLSKALELMLLHGESPTSAAASVGYSDIYHFSKAFKAKYGCSPRQYLDKH